MNNQQLVQQVNKELAMALPEAISLDELQQQLQAHVNFLMVHHFEQLVSLLYRVDVSEANIKRLLQQQPGKDAAEIIAQLIIDRQLEKIKTRQLYKRRDDDMNEAERW
ncbi:MAG: hypothetical protein RL172_1319 [Bacteroidota bacterium]|jgi:hypothetical protein